MLTHKHLLNMRQENITEGLVERLAKLASSFGSDLFEKFLQGLVE